jgi:hypothetical protein
MQQDDELDELGHHMKQLGPFRPLLSLPVRLKVLSFVECQAEAPLFCVCPGSRMTSWRSSVTM